MQGKKKNLPGAGRQSWRRWLDDSPGLTCGGSTGDAAGGCWLENGLDGGRPFFFFSSVFFFFCFVLLCFCFLLLFLTVLLPGVLWWLWRRCCWWLLTGEWLGLWSAFLLLLLCVFFSPALFSSVSVFFFCFSRCCCRVCCGGGCWPVELLWEATVALLLSVQRREPFFFLQLRPSLSISFFSLPYVPPLLFFFSIRSFSPSFSFFPLLFPPLFSFSAVSFLFFLLSFGLLILLL